jgi:hypothetical protein
LPRRFPHIADVGLEPPEWILDYSASMEALHLPFGVGLLFSIQILGVASAVLARLSERSALQPWCHALFLGLLVLMGLATVASLAFGPGITLGSGATLAVMAVAAVCELRPAANLETF